MSLASRKQAMAPNPSLNTELAHEAAQVRLACFVSRLVSADFYGRVYRASTHRQLVVVQALPRNPQRLHHLFYRGFIHLPGSLKRANQLTQLPNVQ